MQKLDSLDLATRRIVRSQVRLVANVCAIVLVAGLVGCRTAPMIQPAPLSVADSDPESIESTRSAIIRGARRTGWSTEAKDPSAQTLHARFMIRPQVFAVVRIDYAGGRVSFRYEDSSRFKCEPSPTGCSTIHKRYNAQLLRLRTQIDQALSEPAPSPIGVSQAISIVRQFIEEQPRRHAYLIVDVTEERVNAIREILKPIYTSGRFDNWGFLSHHGYGHRGYGHHGFYHGFGFYDWSYADVTYVPTQQADVVYFNNIGRIELRDGRRWQVIQIWDRHGELRMQLQSLDEPLARRFVDAVGVLEQARLEVEKVEEDEGDRAAESASSLD